MSADGQDLRPLSVARQSVDDEAALELLYATHWTALSRLAFLLLQDQGRAEEIVQDVFISASPHLAALHARGEGAAYLRRSVVNRCRSFFRRREVERRYLSSVGGGADLPGRARGESAEEATIRASTERAILAAVGALPMRQREVIVLRYYADLSEHQIADVLGISAGAVKSHAHRAVKALRAAVEGERL